MDAAKPWETSLQATEDMLDTYSQRGHLSIPLFVAWGLYRILSKVVIRERTDGALR